MSGETLTIIEAAEPERVPPGYKQTEVGVIPEDWEIVELGDIGDCIIGLTYSPRNISPNGVLVLRSSNIQHGSLLLEDNVFVDAEIPDKLFVRKNDILICVRNGSRRLIGKSILIDERAIGMTFGAFMSVYRSVHNPFVSYQFQSGGIKRQIDAHLGATINQITNKSLEAFQIPLPSNNEQSAIVAALSDVDDLISSLDRLISKKRDVKTAAMQQLLTGKRRLPGFSGKWEPKQLKELGRFSKGKGIKRDDVVSEGFPGIRYGEIYTLHHDYMRRFYSYIPLAVAQTSQKIKKGDLLFTASGETREEIGKCVAYLGDQEAYAGGDIVIFTPDVGSSKFFGYLMNHHSIVAQKSNMGQGDAVVHIGAKSLSELRFSLPSFEEQTAIATALSDMDAEIEALEARREKTRMIKQGMMQELLTGRTRLVERDAAS